MVLEILGCLVSIGKMVTCGSNYIIYPRLEDAGLMETEREETTLYDGREWRIHYWLLKVSEIQSRRDAGPKYAPDDMEPSVYDEIPDDIWSREN